MAGHEPALFPEVARKLAEIVTQVGREGSTTPAHDLDADRRAESAESEFSSWNRT